MIGDPRPWDENHGLKRSSVAAQLLEKWFVALHAVEPISGRRPAGDHADEQGTPVGRDSRI